MESLPPASPLATHDPSPGTDSDAYSFDNFYNAQLPRLSLPEAHRLVEQIRNKLVGGTVSGSVDWHDPEQARTLLSAERNCRATEQTRTGTSQGG